MRRFINPVLFWAVHACHADLIRQIQYLKVENQILRSKLPRVVRLTDRERRRLIRFARPLGRALFALTSVVTMATWYRWFNSQHWIRGNPRKQPGRPRTPAELVQLILRIARETGWGYTRILGGLKKLRIFAVSRSTVVNILKRAGIDPGPKRGEATWDEFVKRHARILWERDFFPRRVLTLRGWRDAYLLIFVNVQSRLAWVSKAEFHPTDLWAARQAAAFVKVFKDSPHRPELILHDRDPRFRTQFRAALEARGATPLRLQSCSPNLNAYAERFVQTIQHECLDHFLLFGRKHLDHLAREFLEYYHTERPHQAVGNVPLIPLGEHQARASPHPATRVICRARFGGLLKDHRWREAA